MRAHVFEIISGGNRCFVFLLAPLNPSQVAGKETGPLPAALRVAGGVRESCLDEPAQPQQQRQHHGDLPTGHC